MANCGTSFLSKGIHSWLFEVRSAKPLQIQDTVNAPIDQLFKIFTVVISAHDGHAECCFNWNVHNISVNCEL